MGDNDKMNDVKIIRRFPSGIITMPPSKSLSHRAVICAALAAVGDATMLPAERRAEGESFIYRIGDSEDVAATLEGIRALGVGVLRKDRTLRVFPAGGPVGNGRVIDCGESGSTLRFLIPVYALDEKETVFTGRGRLFQRPMDVYKRVFADAGVEFVQETDRIKVRGPLRGGTYSLPGDVSSQFVSGLLFALPLTGEDSELHLESPLQSCQYVDLTIDVMARFGVRVKQPDDMRFLIPKGQRYHPAEYIVEADYSQAAYFLAAAALGCDVWCDGLDPLSKQGDRAILDVLEEMGAMIIREDGLVTARADRLSAVKVDARDIPDLIPPIAALCCFCDGKSEIINAGRLRFKESDRLHAMASELTKLGAKIVEGEDSLGIEGSKSLRGGRVDAWGDHRIAMSMALAAIRCEEPVELTGWQNVNKSYPGFWDDFEKEELKEEL